MPKPTFIERGLGDRLLSLRSALLLLRDSIEEVRGGKAHFILPIFTQLRALLAEKSKGNQPLLLELAEVFGFEPAIFSMPGIRDDPNAPEVMKSAVMHFEGFPMGLRKELPAQIAMPLSALLDKHIVTLHDSHYSLKELIEVCANKAGGAHWPRRMKQNEIQLLEFRFGQFQPAHTALFQFAELVTEYGQKFLAETLTQYVNLLVVVPEQPSKSEVSIFKLQYPNGSNSLQLTMRSNGIFRAVISSFNGETISTQCSPDIERDALVHIEVAHELDRQLKSLLSIRINGEIRSEFVAPLPLLYDGRSLHSECLLNEPADSNCAEGLEFGMSQFLNRSFVSDLTAREKLDYYFESVNSNEEIRLIEVGTQTRGKRAQGERNINFEPPSTLTTLESYISSRKKQS